MREETQAPEGAPLSEEIFRLNLSYLMLAQRLVAQDEQRAAIALGVREPSPFKVSFHFLSNRAVDTWGCLES